MQPCRPPFFLGGTKLSSYSQKVRAEFRIVVVLSLSRQKTASHTFIIHLTQSLRIIKDRFRRSPPHTLSEVRTSRRGSRVIREGCIYLFLKISMNLLII